MHDIEIKNMIKMATNIKERAYVPYSGVKVGACLKGESGAFYTGCNVENVSYGLTMCAERVAIGKAISECEKKFTSIAIASNLAEMITPCGACRQVLCEFMDKDAIVILTDGSGKYKTYTLEEILPLCFTKWDEEGMKK